jgi:solute carrier family 35 protein E1
LRSIYAKQLKLTGYSGTAIQLFYEISIHGFILLFLLVTGIELVSPFLPGEWQQYTMRTFLAHTFNLDKLQDLLRLVVMNGLTYAAYNQMSFLVLSLVSVVTHAVGNSFRRIVTIVVSVWMFGNAISLQNASGIALAIFGVILYSLSKARDESEANKTRKG